MKLLNFLLAGFSALSLKSKANPIPIQELRVESVRSSWNWKHPGFIFYRDDRWVITDTFPNYMWVEFEDPNPNFLNYKLQGAKVVYYVSCNESDFGIRQIPIFNGVAGEEKIKIIDRFPLEFDISRQLNGNWKKLKNFSVFFQTTRPTTSLWSVAIDQCKVSLIPGEGIEKKIEEKNFGISFKNPSTNIVKIKYFLDEAGKINLKLYDSNGRLLRNLLNEYKKPGNYSLDLDVEKFPKGVYFLNLELENKGLTKKIIIN